jgi:hypothetical protein
MSQKYHVFGSGLSVKVPVFEIGYFPHVLLYVHFLVMVKLCFST